MRRVVVTGMGIVSAIGNNTQEVLASLHDAKSGISRAEKHAELGFRSQVVWLTAPLLLSAVLWRMPAVSRVRALGASVVAGALGVLAWANVQSACRTHGRVVAPSVGRSYQP